MTNTALSEKMTEMSNEVHVPTVLVVDDVEGNRAILCRRLEKSGFRYVTAESGQRALDLMETFIPDIVLLDYMMPNLGGIDVLRIMRDDPRTKDIPVIMVTARTESDAVSEALGAGADDYVTKPIDFTALQARIERQLAKCQNDEHLRRANSALDNRVTMRAMALAELQEELESEVRQRKSLEAQLSAGAPVALAPNAEVAPQLAASLNRIDEICQSLYNSIADGKTPNLALLAEVRVQVAAVKSHVLG